MVIHADVIHHKGHEHQAAEINHLTENLSVISLRLGRRSILELDDGLAAQALAELIELGKVAQSRRIDDF